MTDPRSPEGFDNLRKLLALKRNELPPPGFFDGFSGKVLARIESRRVEDLGSWWHRLAKALYRRPLEAWYCGVLGVVLAVVTVGVTQSSETDLVGQAEALRGFPVLEATLDWSSDLPGDSLEALEQAGSPAFETATVGRSALAPAVFDFGSSKASIQPVSYSY